LVAARLVEMTEGEGESEMKAKKQLLHMSMYDRAFWWPGRFWQNSIQC